MTATVYRLPARRRRTQITTSYEWHLLGKRVQHRVYGVTGRLTGNVRYDRGTLWLEVDTADEDGPYWWARTSLELLGPIPVPGGGAT